jgi:GTP-binding protein
MNIKSAQFYKAITQTSPLPEEIAPLFVFMGRSNVGKSSFINAITEKKDLCRSGSKPGVTQKVNLFLINQNIYFADLPGYGYAKLSKGERKQLEALIFWFLENQKFEFTQLFLLIDSRLGPTEQDKEMIKYLLDRKFPLTLILSKTDKLNKNQKLSQLNKVKTLYPGITIIPFSTKEKEGTKEVHKALLRLE